MTYEQIKSDMNLALKNGDKTTRLVLADMVAAIEKAATAGKARVEITEELVDEVLIKYQKTIQEMIDTCPAERVDLSAQYVEKMDIVKLYAPQLLTDPEAIRERIIEIVATTGLALTKQNKGAIMKLVMPQLKGKADGKIINQVMGELLS